MIRGSLLALLGLASFVAVYAMLDPREATGPEGETSAATAPDGSLPDDAPLHTTSINDPGRLGDPVPVTFELRPGTELQPPEEIAESNIRNVTPSNMTAGPRVTGPLTRVETPSAAEAESEARRELIYNPLVISADTIKAGGRNIHLAGIAAPDFEARCGEGTEAWPCGRMARAALRRFIRGRAIECEVPAGASDIPDPATCRVAGEDIAEWLVKRGWAKRDGDRYGDQEDAAREARIGLWSDSRPDAQLARG